MLEGMQIVGGDSRFTAFMLGMAAAAIFSIGQAAMYTNSGEALIADICVTTFAAVGRAALPGRVASGALRFKIGMGIEAS